MDKQNILYSAPSPDSKRLTELFLQLCRVNTPPLHEKPLIDIVQILLEEMGLECLRDNAHLQTGGDSGNLIANLPGSIPGGMPIFFSAHFDTVEANPDVQIVIEGDIIRTDGASILGADDKAGMASIIEAVRVIIENKLPHGDIQLLLTVSEEIGLRGAAAIDRGLISARMGYVLDTGPPVGSVVYTAPTHDILDVTFYGKAAHAGFEPEKGISAIQAAARAIDRMHLGRIDSETTANVGIIQGGTATNVIPQMVNIRAEARSRNTDKLGQQIDHMKQTFEEAAKDFQAEVNIQVTREYESYQIEDNAPVIQLAMQGAKQIGLPTHLRAAGGGSDANIFNKMGIPACVLGTGMKNIHTHQENIAIPDMIRSSEWVISICNAVLS
jgi:tripeptide aminopeptidase